jgi:hypothetical protein
MATKKEIEKFLEQIKVEINAGVYLLLVEDREKNAQALLDLDITPNKRKEIILSLKAEDFYKEEEKYIGKYPMYAFGKLVKKMEVYIKITKTTQNVICISFHKAEFSITYPFKPQK